MRLRWMLALLLIPAPFMEAQNDPLQLDDLLQSAQQWAQENLDERVLQALRDVDQEQVQKLFQDLQQRFQGDYVVNLASLKQTAQTLLPLLEAHSETRPYAAWLRTRLDYLEVADEFRLTISPPKVEPGQPPKPVPNPGPDMERKAWRQQVAQRPAPKGAQAYVSRLKPVFAAQRVPAELVWLAEVESAFEPTARSPAGAAGLYQLMPTTARRFGLSLRPTDERLQPEPSARAAARYLKLLHDRFRDWRLTLAAYNAGEGTVQKLLDRYKARTFDAIATHLPAETQMYVPRVEATLQRREGVALARLKAP
jgi:membrane-bound lytic murein transglycosylase D